MGERRARGTGKRVEAVCLAVLIACVIEERAECRPDQVSRSIGYLLHSPFDIELGGHDTADTIQRLESPRFLRKYLRGTFGIIYICTCAVPVGDVPSLITRW